MFILFMYYLDKQFKVTYENKQLILKSLNKYIKNYSKHFFIKISAVFS